MKKRIALLLTGILFTLTFAGCSNSNSVNNSTNVSENAGKEKIFRWSSMSAVTNISPFEGNTEVVDYIQGTLYRYVPNSTRKGIDLVPDLAEAPPTTQDGYTWNIKIDKNAKWANGEAINADTFIYSWQKALDPKMVLSNASGLAQNIITVKNAYDYYTQKSKGVEVAWEDVGLKKVDDYTLSVITTEKYTAAQVMQHFQMRYTGPVYQPLYDSGISADGTSTKYGTEADLFMASGPFVLSSWTKGAERVFKKNVNYVHANEVKLDGMYVREVADEVTQLQLYQNGEIDFLELGSNGYPVYGDDPRVIAYDSATLREIEINFQNPNKKYLNNLNFRKALYYAIDRDTAAKLNNNKGASYFLPDQYTVSEKGTSIRDLKGATDYLPKNNGYDKALALEYFNKALQEEGITKVDLTLMYNEAVSATRASSEYIQSKLTEIFGADRFNLNIVAKNNAEAVKMMRTAQKGPTSDWDLCWGAWDLTAATYSANKKFEVYRTTDSRRLSQYQNKEIDRLFALSISEEYRLDEKKLGEATLAMEKSLLENVDCIPVFQQVQYYIFNERIQLPLETRARILGFGYQYIDIK
jgi:oligopeptide transport system substrate-binding protein